MAEAAERPQRSPVERAAILLMSLGESDAAQMLKLMDAKEVQRVGAAMAQLSGVSRDEIAEVLQSFHGQLAEQTSVGVDSGDYVRRMLTEALGAEKAEGIADRVLGVRPGRGLDALRWMEPGGVAEILRREHPQIAAIVMTCLDAEQASSVLLMLPESVRADIVMRIARLESVSPSALKELDEVFERQLSGTTAHKAAGLGGPKVAAGIMNLVGANNEAPIFEQMGQMDAELVTEIQDLMLVFNDLVEANDRGLQQLLREVPGEQLILALKAADEKTKSKFFRNMSERSAEALRDDLANKGPVRLSEVEAAQKEILLTARRLAEEGRLQLGSKGAQEYV